MDCPMLTRWPIEPSISVCVLASAIAGRELGDSDAAWGNMNWKIVVEDPKNDLRDVGMDAVSIVERYGVFENCLFFFKSIRS